MNPLRLIGHAVLALCETVGELLLFAGRAIAAGVIGPYYPRQIGAPARSTSATTPCRSWA